MPEHINYEQLFSTPTGRKNPRKFEKKKITISVIKVGIKNNNKKAPS